ncbi:hypothetical protein LEMLEM_LOCUS24487, partial [Lemmus lemmus]
ISLAAAAVPRVHGPTPARYAGEDSVSRAAPGGGGGGEWGTHGRQRWHWIPRSWNTDSCKLIVLEY